MKMKKKMSAHKFKKKIYLFKILKNIYFKINKAPLLTLIYTLKILLVLILFNKLSIT